MPNAGENIKNTNEIKLYVHLLSYVHMQHIFTEVIQVSMLIKAMPRPRWRWSASTAACWARCWVRGQDVLLIVHTHTVTRAHSLGRGDALEGLASLYPPRAVGDGSFAAHTASGGRIRQGAALLLAESNTWRISKIQNRNSSNTNESRDQFYYI